MLITIYDSVGNPKVDLSPNDNSTQVKEVQGDSVLTLSFTHYDHIELDVDDYADFLGERFWLTEKYRPRQNSKKEWVYDLKLYGVESMIKRLLVIKTVDDEENPVFTLTAPPREHVAMIVKCMNDGMGNITDWKVGQVDGTENIVIDYFGKYCDEALKEIAEKVGAEWWAEGQTVNICKCEHGEAVELGYNKGLLSIDTGNADNVKFYTRLYPVGSSRNIDPEKYGHLRLQLPDGIKYVEINADKYGRVDHFEQSAFEDIYPRRVGTISSVRSEVKTGEDGNPFTIYYFTDDSLPFDPNAYMIGGHVIRVSFQEGSELAGLGEEDNGTYFFEVNFNSTTREFEIITIWPYDNDIQLPGDKLVPKAGDKYILWNLRMPDEYYALAEEEFLTAVNKYNDDHNLDISVYKAPTDHVWIEDNNVELTIGRRVRLESKEYFPGVGFRDSRITRITRKVNLPSSMDIEISDALSRTSQERMNDSISEVHSYAKSIADSLSLPDIIRTGDKTRPTDNNLYSAKRVIFEFLSKLKDDRSKGKIASDLGFEIGNYLAGVSGGIFGIDADNGDSFAEVARLFVRSKAYFETLTTIESRTLAGKLYLSPGGSVKCTKVEEVKDSDGNVTAYRCYFLSEQDGEKTETKITAGDQAISEMFNAQTGVSNNKLSNHRYWRLVTTVNNDAYTDESGNHYGYIELSATDCETGSDIPKEGDVIDQFGNRTDKTRQSAMVFSTVDSDSPSIKMFAGIDSYSLTDKTIIAFGREATTGKVYFRLGTSGAAQFLDYRQDDGLTLAGKLSVNSTIGDKALDEYFGDIANEALDEYKYLKEAIVNGASQAIGGLFLSSQIRLGHWDKTNPDNPVLSTVYAGMNGNYGDGRTIALWWGGDMLDRFKGDDTRKTLAELIEESGSNNPRPAASLMRMDGSVYFLDGDIQFRRDRTAIFGSDDSAITIANGRVKLGNGITIDIGGDAQGLADSIASVTTLANGLSNLFTPYNGTSALTWRQVLYDGENYDSLRVNKSLWTDGSLAGMGAVPPSGSGSGGGGSSYDRLDSWAEYTSAKSGWVLSALLGVDLHNRVSSLEGKNYLDALNLSQSGSGNAVTALSLSADHKTLTATKGATFLKTQPLNGGLVAVNTSSWGNQTGLPVAAWADTSSGCEFKFMKNNPVAGQMSMLIDGTVYINEGRDAVASQSWVNGRGFLTAHQSLDNYVTLSTAQTITGVKTFSSDVTFQQTVNTYGFRLRFLENSNFQGAFIGYDGANNIFQIGVHDLNDTNISNDINVISILRGSANVGIGTSTPTQKLHVDGNILASQFRKSGGTAEQILMADGSVVTKKSANGVTHTEWAGLSASALVVPDMTFMSYWNGAYSSWGDSNLAYCNKGAFGSMATASKEDYLQVSSYTAADVLAKIKTVDGSGSGLDANLLEGLTLDQVRSTAMRFHGWMSPTATTDADLNLLTWGMAHNYWGQSKWVNAPSGMSYGAAITFAQFGYDNLYGQLAWDVNHATADVTRNLYWRAFATASDGTNKWGGWRQIAFTDGTVANATDADKLDGLHSTAFARSGHTGNVDLNTVITSGIYGTGGSCTNAPLKTEWGQLLVLHGPSDTPIAQMLFSYNANGLVYIRSGAPTDTGGKGNWGAWKQLALMDSNVASATKLADNSTFNAWGQTFFKDGKPQSVSGALEHVKEIRFDNGNSLLQGTSKSWDFWSAGGFYLYPSMSATVCGLSIRANGNVGVHMFQPQYDFDVTGVIHASGVIFSDTAIGGKGLPSSSDARLKHIIGDVGLPFEAILNAPTKRFKWLDGKDEAVRCGTIAQYWLSVLPEVVYTNPDGFLAVDYGVLAHAEVQTVARVVERLVARVNQFEMELNQRI